MSEEILYASARFGIGIGFLMFVALFMYRKTRLDSFRSDLFAIRDEAFTFMLRRNRPFDDPAYQRLRDSLNGTIRFAHQFDLAAVVFASLIVREEPGRPSLISILESVEDPETRAYFIAVYHRTARRSMRYVLFEGSQSIVMVPLIVVYVLWKRRGKWIAELPPATADRLMSLGRRDSREARSLLGA